MQLNIKQILVAKYKNMNLKLIVRSLNYLEVKCKDHLFKLLQKHENMFDGV